MIASISASRRFAPLYSLMSLIMALNLWQGFWGTAMAGVPDPRHISNGWPIPSEGYADQPYIVKTDDGAWLCVITTGTGVEGAKGQHVVSMRSTDRGKTWFAPVDVEPVNGPEASYAVLLKTPGGRIYCFYNHNTDNVREVKTETGGTFSRVDSLGHYVFKYSDDHGHSWSAKRYEVPVRKFDCDLTNVYGGQLCFFWNVGKPLVFENTALLVMHKVGAMGNGFFAQSEGAFIRSENLLIERSPEKISFETLPEGTVGLRTPLGGGRVAEEQSIVRLSDGSLYCVYRTVDGWPACSYSRDGGRHWSTPAYAAYQPGGKRIKHPRAANFVWRCSNGKYLYWFHNHGGAAIRAMAESRLSGSPYDDRNPAWLMAGKEDVSPEGKILVWSQPEILLYDDDSFIRMSYPDLVEEEGVFYITETQKNIGRVHEIPKVLTTGLFDSWSKKTIATNGLILRLPAGNTTMPQVAPMPRLREFVQRDTKQMDHRTQDLRTGFTLDLWLQLEETSAGQTVLDSRDSSDKGILLKTVDNGAVQIVLNDGRTECAWRSDEGLLKPNKRQHVVVIVDGGPKMILFVVDGILSDGGAERQFGWGRFSPDMRAPNPEAIGERPLLKLGPMIKGRVLVLRLYNRALRTSEAVAHHRAGPGI